MATEKDIEIADFVMNKVIKMKDNITNAVFELSDAIKRLEQEGKNTESLTDMRGALNVIWHEAYEIKQRAESQYTRAIGSFEEHVDWLKGNNEG